MSRELCARLTDLVLYIDSGNPYTTYVLLNVYDIRTYSLLFLGQ